MSEQASGVGRQASGPKAPRWAWWVATGFGSGYLRPAPGTWGSLAAVIAWCALMVGPWFYLSIPSLLLPISVGLAALITVLAIQASHRVVDETGFEDPGFIVADEWAGQWIAYIPTAWFSYQAHYGLIFLGDSYWVLVLPLAVPFSLFRLFDIWKPWPCFQLQELPRGWGVVADDVIAGIYAAIVTAVAMPWFPVGRNG